MFWPQKVLLWPSNKKISYFCTGFHKTIFRLSPERIFDLLTHLQPFQIRLEMKIKVQNWTKMSIYHRTINHKKIWNVPLDALICPLQIINDIEPLSSTLHGVNACFIHHPSNVENYSIGHKLETGQPKQKKIVFWRIYFYTSILVLGLKFKIQMAENLCATFWTSVKSTLNGPANGPEVEVTYSKIQNRLWRAP